ncbi:MAG: hypothetical protein HFE90_01640 [Firmicutes bacterium]|nr:hypothetical protein [Bacillota bacterium]
MKRIDEAGYLEVSDLQEYFCMITDFLEFIAMRLGIELDDVKRKFCEDTLNSIESGEVRNDR